MQKTHDPSNATKMFLEAAETPLRVEKQLTTNQAVIDDVAEVLASDKIHSVVTCGRGSSSHATVYGKYLLEPALGKQVCAFSPSIASIFGADLNLKDVLFLAVSQSGRSEDLLRSVEMAGKGGAVTVGLTNAPDSPLADLCDTTIPMLAGPETSVAATKSFICSLTTLAALAFSSGADTAGREALQTLPALLNQAWNSDWTLALPTLSKAGSLFVTSRGAGLGIAKEAALKLKETSGLHAEALSAAELRHGPMAVVSDGFPILSFVPSDTSRQSVVDLAAYCASHGAECIMIGMVGVEIPGVLGLECPAGDDARLTPILQVQRFYRFANALSLSRGKNPDNPPHLKKVTVTV